MSQFAAKTFVATLFAAGLFAAGCASSSNSPSIGVSGASSDTSNQVLPGLGAPLGPVTVSPQTASALASLAVSAGSVPSFLPTESKVSARLENPTAVTTAIPTLDIQNPNGSALAAALAVALKGGGSIVSPLGGSCLIDKGLAVFDQFKTPTGTLDGQIAVRYEFGGPSTDFLARLEFTGLTLSAGGQSLIYNGKASLEVTGLVGVHDVRWTSDLGVVDGASSSSLSYQNFIANTHIEPNTVTLTMSGKMLVSNVNQMNGRVTVETLTPFEFHGLVGNKLRLDKGKMLVQGTSVVEIEANGYDTDTVTVSLGGPIKVVSWNYLGGLARLLHAFRPVVAGTILRNANVITLNDAQPRAQALAIRDGLILKVGSNEQINAFKDATTEVVEMKGKTVLPGFIEPHMHYDLTSLHMSAVANTNVNGSVPANPLLIDAGLYQVSNPAQRLQTKQEVIDALTQAVTNHPGAGAIFAFNFDPSRLQPADQYKNLTLQDLDNVSAQIPIVVQNASGHISYANSAAFRKAKPKGGSVIWPTAPAGPYTAQTGLGPTVIVTDVNTTLPTGQINENGQGPFLGIAIQGALGLEFETDPLKAERAVQWIKNWRTMQEKLAAKGITTGVDILMGANSVVSLDFEAEVVAKLEAREDCPTRARIYVNGEVESMDAINVFAGEGNSRMRFVGAKFITDGSTQGFTAGLKDNIAYLVPIIGFVFPVGPNGLLDYADSAALFPVIERFYSRGFQLCFHANGDKAFDVVVGALNMLGPDVKNRRSRLEHFTVHQTNDLPAHVQTCQQLGLYPGHTIGHVFYWGKAFDENILGSDLAQNIDPVDPLLKGGIKVSLHSDSPISPFDPLLFVQTAATRFYQAPPGGTPQRLGPQHGVSVIEALKCVTLYPAEATFSETEIGSLEEGKYGDIVVLDQDPTAIDLNANPNAIAVIPILQTRLAGRLVSGANP